jgi:DNA-binding transcriptional regulator YhcF (GntR family)
MFSGIRFFFSRVFSFVGNRKSVPPAIPQMQNQPYKDGTSNLTYNSLFCDDIRFFRNSGRLEGPWKLLSMKDAKVDSLKSIAENSALETTARILAYNVLRSRGIINSKEVMGVVIEVGAAGGPDVMAVYNDLRAQYISETGKVLISEDSAAEIKERIETILSISRKIIGKAEPWNKARPSPPPADEFRITFLVTDGVYVGQGKLAELNSDPVASAMVALAGELMVILAKRAREAKQQSAGKTPAAAGKGSNQTGR